MLPLRRLPGIVLVILVVGFILTGCRIKETEKTLIVPSPSPLPEITTQAIVLPTPQITETPTIILTPTVFTLGPLIEADLDLREGPVELPLELQIPALEVTAPMMGVGLTDKGEMDSPKGDIGDPIWHTAFWYRGGGIPGDIGTATIAGHVNDPLGEPEIFAHLRKLKPGDLIVIRDKTTGVDIKFSVDEVKVYSVIQSAKPEILTRIYGEGPVIGTGPQPAPDGLSHLTLITCAGYIIDGEFDRHTVVFATRSN